MENIPKEILKMQVGAMVFGPHDNRLMAVNLGFD